MTLPAITVRRGDADSTSTAFVVEVNGSSVVARARDQDACRKYATLLSTREVLVLVAAHHGRVRARVWRRHGYGFTDERMVAECDDFGVGPHTLARMQRDDLHHAAFITSPKRPGPVRLTAYGRVVLEGLAALPGFTLNA